MKKYLTDWLGTNPVFYNEKTLAISHNINDVIDWTNIEFHPEGLNNYLDFGYSVFEQTPLKNIKFLRYSSEVYIKNDKLIVNHKADPVETWLELNPEYKEEREVLQLIQEKVQSWEKSTAGDIVLPISGGYDSRLLSYFLEDKSRVKGFTYGLSNKQTDSYEVINAKELCKRLGIEWKQIELGEFHRYIDDWDSQYGVSTHAHGMYQVEFYEKIGEYLKGGEGFLSGIIGDAWAGSIPMKHVENYTQLVEIGYTHGLTSSSKYSKLKTEFTLKKEFYERNKRKLENSRSQIVEVMRSKIILLSYLMKFPKLYGYKPWSPYLDLDVALSMISISPERRSKRLWQKEFFKNVGLDLESENLGGSKLNYLNHKGLEKGPLRPLRTNLLREIIDEDYIEEVNRVIENPPPYMKSIRSIYRLDSCDFMAAPVIFTLKRLGLKDPILKAYSAYLTLKPLEKLLEKRELYLKEK